MKIVTFHFVLGIPTEGDEGFVDGGGAETNLFLSVVNIEAASVIHLTACLGDKKNMFKVLSLFFLLVLAFSYNAYA